MNHQLATKLFAVRDLKKSLQAGRVSRASLDTRPTRESLISRLARGRPGPPPRLPIGHFIDDPYPPCNSVLASLSEIDISSLQLEEHHRGRVLFARRIESAIFSHCNAQFGIEDGKGDVAFITLQTHSIPSDDVLDRGAVVAIKEPYYCLGYDGITQVYVAHPGDLIVFQDGDERIPWYFREAVPHSTKTAEELKKTGNHKFAAGRYVEAIDLYSKAIDSAQQSAASLRADLLRNRALAYLRSGKFDGAKTDALAAVLDTGNASSEHLDAKAFWIAGRASYSLGNFDEAGNLFRRLLDLLPGNEDGVVQLNRTAARLREQTTGDYDFDRIVDLVASGKFSVDAANFLAKVEVRPSATHGHGLFATEGVKTGELVLVEKAIYTARREDPGIFDAIKLHVFQGNEWRVENSSCGYKALVRKLFANPSLIPKVTTLCAGPTGTTTPQPNLSLIDGQPVLDSYQIHEIFATNTFALPVLDKVHETQFPFCAKDGKGKMGSGLWYTISRINHDCVPNTGMGFLGDLAVVRARRDISAGEEITLSYGSDEDWDSRQNQFRKIWSFTCSCALCSADAKTPTGVRARRKELLAQLTLLCKNKDSDITTIERTVDGLSTTYDDQIYQGLPRPALAQAYTMLYLVYKGRQYPLHDLLTTLERALEADQIDIPTRTSTANKGSSLSLVPQQKRAPNEIDTKNLVELAALARAMGLHTESRASEEAARVLYRVLNGYDTGFVLFRGGGRSR